MRGLRFLVIAVAAAALAAPTASAQAPAAPLAVGVEVAVEAAQAYYNPNAISRLTSTETVLQVRVPGPGAWALEPRFRVQYAEADDQASILGLEGGATAQYAFGGGLAIERALVSTEQLKVWGSVSAMVDLFMAPTSVDVPYSNRRLTLGSAVKLEVPFVFGTSLLVGFPLVEWFGGFAVADTTGETYQQVTVGRQVPTVGFLVPLN